MADAPLPTTLRTVPVLAWAGVLGAGWWRGTVPAWALGLLAGLCAFAFVLHAWDKRRAKRGGRRVPEAALHAVELLGGWPGALLGMRLVRHKTAKLGYRLVFWCCAAANFAAVLWWVWRGA